MNQSTKNTKWLILPLSCLILGLVVGFSSGLLGLFLEETEHFFLGWVETAQAPVASSVRPLRRLIATSLGGLLVAGVWAVIRKRYRRIPTVSQAVLGNRMPIIPTLLHVLAQIFFVGTGGSVGREVAPREAGALFAQIWQKMLKKAGLSALSKEDQELLIAAAAGAGFAGVYLAPLTGMFFTVEILLRKVTVRTVAVSLSMSALATYVGGAVRGTGPYYVIGAQKFTLPFLVLILLIAPLAGVLGTYFRKGSQWAESHQTRSRAILWQLPVMGLLTGLLSFAGLPEIMGNGRALAQTALNSLSLQMLPILLIGAALKAVVTLLTIRSGAAGGVLTPAIAVGSSVGAIISLLLQGLVPGFSIWQGAILGAACLLAASQQAPLMALFMLLEISQLPLTSVLPLGLGVALAAGISHLLLKQSNQAL